MADEAIFESIVLNGSLDLLLLYGLSKVLPKVLEGFLQHLDAEVAIISYIR